MYISQTATSGGCNSLVEGSGVPDALLTYGGTLGYGNYKLPKTMGSSGTPGYENVDKAGGAGGAALELRAATLSLDGIIEMNGEDGEKDMRGGCRTGSGGGAGGSILLRVDGEIDGSGAPVSRPIIAFYSLMMAFTTALMCSRPALSAIL
jgi:hypothetical protein